MNGASATQGKGVWPLVVVALIALRPFASFYALNIGEGIRPIEVAIPAAFALALALGGGLSLWVSPLRGSLRAWSVYAGALFMFVSFGGISQLAEGAGQGPFGQVSSYLAVSAGVVFLAWRLGASPGFLQFLGIFSLGNLAVSAFQIVGVDPSPPALPTVEAYPLAGNPFWSGQARRRPDIYWFVLDSYPNRQVAAEYGLDDSLAEALRKRGFHVSEDSWSNYNFTSHTMATAFNMEPVYAPDEFFMELRRGTWTMRRGRTNRSVMDTVVGDNRSVGFLRQLGYRYVHFSSGFVTVACRGYEDLCVGPGRPQRPTLQQALIDLTAYRLVDAALQRIERRLGRRVEKSDLESFPEIPPAKADAPTFLYAHFRGAHAPFNYDSECRPTRMGSTPPAALDGEAIRRLFVGQSLCVSKQVIELIERIEGEAPGAILIVSGDHGPRLSSRLASNWDFTTPVHELDQAQIRDHLGTLQAIRVPEACRGALPASFTSADTMRIVFACLGDHPPRLSQPEHFVGDWWRGNESFGTLLPVDPRRRPETD